MTVSFGAPAPLPGQPGFRSTPSEVMARETAKMAERLARLKNDLAIEASLHDAETEKGGGARWRSARTDRRSVRAYAKDIKHRHQQKMLKRLQPGIFARGGTPTHGKPQAGAGARAAAALREEQRMLRQELQRVDSRRSSDPETPNVQTTGGFANKQASQWSLRDTLDWLDSLGLGQYRNVFEENEISGTILLEVGSDDLDYMDVRVLAHRKLILRGVEELRRLNMNSTNTPPPKPAEQTGAEECVVREVSRDRGESLAPFAEQVHDEVQQPKEQPTRSLRCHLVPPLKGYAVADDRDQAPPKCKTNDEYGDDRMVHLGSVVRELSDRRYETLAHPTLQEGNPTRAGRFTDGTCHQQRSVAKERARFEVQQSATTRREGTLMLGVKSPAECWTNPFDPRSDTSSAHDSDQDKRSTRCEKIHDVEPTTQEGFPTINEEAEHHAFRQAVAEWNSGRSNISRSGTGATQGSNGDSNQSSGTTKRVHISRETEGAAAASARRRATELQIESLRQQMDSDHRKQSKVLDETRKTLLRELGAQSWHQIGIDDAADEAYRSQGTGRSEHDRESALQDDDPKECATGNCDETTSIVSCASSLDETWGSDHSTDGSHSVGANGITGAGGIEIEIMESVLGTGTWTERRSSSYVVEGDTSSEEG